MNKKIENGENYAINLGKEVKVTKYDISGNIKITDCAYMPYNINPTRKINKEEYIDLRTGEIKKYKKETEENRAIYLRKKFKRVFEMILNNFDGSNNELFITLTVKDDISIKELKKQFAKFRRKLQKLIPNIMYICVFEKASKWHAHLLTKDNTSKSLYIENSKLKELWEIGFVQTKRITKINDDEAFGDKIKRVSSYFCKENCKQDIPENESFYSKSKNIKMPQNYKTLYGLIRPELNENYSREQENTYLIKYENDVIINKVKTENWKHKKNK